MTACGNQNEGNSTSVSLEIQAANLVGDNKQIKLEVVNNSTPEKIDLSQYNLTVKIETDGSKIKYGPTLEKEFTIQFRGLLGTDCQLAAGDATTPIHEFQVEPSPTTPEVIITLIITSDEDEEIATKKIKWEIETVALAKLKLEFNNFL